MGCRVGSPKLRDPDFAGHVCHDEGPPRLELRDDMSTLGILQTLTDYKVPAGASNQTVTRAKFGTICESIHVSDQITPYDALQAIREHRLRSQHLPNWLLRRENGL